MVIQSILIQSILIGVNCSATPSRLRDCEILDVRQSTTTDSQTIHNTEVIQVQMRFGAAVLAAQAAARPSGAGGTVRCRRRRARGRHLAPPYISPSAHIKHGDGL